MLKLAVTSQRNRPAEIQAIHASELETGAMSDRLYSCEVWQSLWDHSASNRVTITPFFRIPHGQRGVRGDSQEKTSG